MFLLIRLWLGEWGHPTVFWPHSDAFHSPGAVSLRFVAISEWLKCWHLKHPHHNKWRAVQRCRNGWRISIAPKKWKIESDPVWNSSDRYSAAADCLSVKADWCSIGLQHSFLSSFLSVFLFFFLLFGGGKEVGWEERGGRILTISRNENDGRCAALWSIVTSLTLLLSYWDTYWVKYVSPIN